MIFPDRTERMVSQLMIYSIHTRHVALKQPLYFILLPWKILPHLVVTIEVVPIIIAIRGPTTNDSSLFTKSSGKWGLHQFNFDILSIFRSR